MLAGGGTGGAEVNDGGLGGATISATGLVISRTFGPMLGSSDL